MKRLAAENGLTRADAIVAWQYGLIKIAHRLNAPRQTGSAAPAYSSGVNA
jgi:hypothetical protein